MLAEMICTLPGYNTSLAIVESQDLVYARVRSLEEMVITDTNDVQAVEGVGRCFRAMAILM